MLEGRSRDLGLFEGAEAGARKKNGLSGPGASKKPLKQLSGAREGAGAGK